VEENLMRNIKKYTEEYVRTAGFEKFQIAYRRRKILEIVSKYQPRRLIEIGCGMQPLFQYLDDTYERFVVVEPSDKFYQNAINLAGGDDRIECIHGYFCANSYLKKINSDFIVCSGLLHELENPQELLKDITAICNQRTIVHINVPNANSVHRIIAKEIALIDDLYQLSDRNISLQQNTVFDLESLQAMVTASGLTIIDSGSYFIKPFTHCQMQEIIDNGILSEKVLDGLYSLEKYMKGYGSEIYVNAVLEER